MKVIRWLACVLAFATIGLLVLRSAPPVAGGVTLVVDDDGQGSASNCDSSDVAYTTIQAAIDAAAADDTISVCPGTYDQDEANGRDPNTGGAGSNDFNIFVNKALTIQGVDTSGTPITNYNNVVAHVIAKRNLPTFGPSAIFVQADNVTITGLELTGWSGVNYENNKTLEVAGDNVILKYSKVHGLDGASAFYISDWHFDPGTNTSHLRTYRIEGNLLDGGGPDADGIRISSGAGWSGPVSGRVISGNTFNNTIDGIAFVGPGADPWDKYPVGDATITGNSFSLSDRRHVIAWGEYLGGPGYINLDWQAIVQNNTFDKAAITWTPGGDARSWDVPPQFKNVRGIYSAIQRYAVNKAVAGDTVQVLPGTYDEQVVIDRSLTLQGAGDTTVIKPSSDAKLTTVLDGHWWGATKQVAGIVVANVPDGSSVTVKSLKVDGASVTAKPAGADYVAGIFYRETGGTIDAVTVTNMTVGTTGTEVRGDGIYLSAVANTVSVEVKGCTLTNYDKNGIDAWGNKLSLNIHGNTLTGRGPLPQGDEVQNGVVIGDGASGTVDQNVISNHTYSPETWWSAGIMFLDSGGSSSATGNTLTSNQIGVMFQDGNGSASGNTVSGGKLGLYAQGTKAGTWTASFTGNTVGGSDTVGIGGATYDLGASLTISIGDNSLTGGTGDGVAIGDAPEYDPAGTVAATITGNFISGWQNGVNLLSSLAGSSTIYSNSIAGNVSRGVLNQTAVLADASGNWWGTNTPAGVAGQVSANVDYTPWLDSGTDKEPGTPGFQGDFSTLNVDDDSPQSGATGRVQEGVNMVSGSTVKVWPGTYSEQVSIAKANLTLDGAGIGSTIVKPASVTANTTSLYSGAPIATIILVNGVTGVTIKGLTVDGSSAAFNSCSPGYMGIFYRNASGTIDSTRVTNIFHPSARGCQSVIGIFAQSGGGGGSTVQVSSSTVDNYGKNGITCNELGTACTISGNTVTGRGPVGAGDAAQNGIQLGFGATGTVDGNTVSNNSYTGPTWAATDVLVISADVGITGNTLNNGQIGLYYIDGSGTISGNTVSATTAGVGRPDYWGIAVSDPPGLSASPFEERAAPPAGGFSAAPMGAGVMTVVVSGNTLTGDGSASSVGLEADAGWGPENVDFTASGNTISNWGTGVTAAQCTSGCTGAVFTSVDVGPNNNISGNDNGVFLGGVSGVVISGNEIHHNLNRPGYAGVGIMLWGDNDNNQILGNVVHDNDRQGIFVGHDTLISTGNVISGNRVYNNGLNTNPNPPDASAYGIQLWNADSSTITNNEVYGHDDWFYYPGFDFAQGIYLFDSNHNVLSGNYLHDNNYGVGLWGPGRGDGSNLINFNNISGNTGYGVRNFDSLTVNAENNWWGCSGPYHPTLNPLGTGDAVSDNVDFDPWITGPCDADGDGLTDDQEKLIFFTNPNDPDTDHDGFYDDGVDVDGPGPGQPNDNCPLVPNPGQENADNQIGNGISIPGHDSTVPNSAGDNIGDACDSPDADNDGIPNASDSDPGGDITYDDNNNGIMCPADTADDGPSWDHNCNGKLDGKDLVPGSCPLAVNPNGDDDGDGLKNTWEVCKWGTNPAVIDSDGDTLGDCQEAADVDGNRVVDFTGDVMSYAQAVLLAPAAFGRDGDFDIDGNNNLDFTGDVMQEAMLAFTAGLCK